MKLRWLLLAIALLIVVCFLQLSLRRSAEEREVNRQEQLAEKKSDFAPLPRKGEPAEAPTRPTKAPSRSMVSSSSGTLTLPAPDIQPLLAEARRRDEANLPYRFATPIEVSQPISRLAPWRADDGQAFWSLVVESPGAESLNFAFNDVYLPPGAALKLTSLEDGLSAEFTSRDNDDHGELWTPLFLGHRVLLEVEMPLQLVGDFSLALNKVNYGFRKIGGKSSGSCNIDVICDADDLEFGSFIDLFRDQIRSVGAFTLNGTDACSGALVNNTLNDNQPYFLTAEHCEIDSSNDASVVVYWNYQNSTCREPGSTASGLSGDGPTSIFNSGSIYRASFAATDFCLIELDDPIHPNAEAYFAGWDRTGDIPVWTTGIHHPSVAEKRISFDWDSPLTDIYDRANALQDSHWRVNEWDEGTTEGGSSGSALFNQDGYLIGDLSGGAASCSNPDGADWYGRFSVSWTGGGSSNTRLSDWLDPAGLSPLILDGVDHNPFLSLEDSFVLEGDSGNTTGSISVTLSEASSETITCEIMASGGTALSGTDYQNPGTQILTFAPGETTATFDITILGDTEPEENEDIVFIIQNATNANISGSTASFVILNDDYVPPTVTGPPTIDVSKGEALSEQIETLNTPTYYEISNAPEGLTIDPVTGALYWSSAVEGSYNVEVFVSNPAGSDNGSFLLTVSASAAFEALDLPAGATLDMEEEQWFSQSAYTRDGEDALRISGLSDGESASFSLTIEGPEEVAFWWRASSEFDYDFLHFLVDNSVVASLSGVTDWSLQRYSVPEGEHQLTFRYAKDSTESAGLDSAWVDQFTIASLSPPAFVPDEEILIPSDEQFVIPAETVFSSESLAFSDLGTGLTTNDENHLTGSLTASTSFTATAVNANGSTTRTFTLVPVETETSLAAALDEATLKVLTEGDADWYAQSQSSYTTQGSSSARSGPIENEESSTMSLYLLGPGEIQFDWRVSSEADYDFGFCFLDGLLVSKASGIGNGWETVTLDLSAGYHSLTWSYVKDYAEDDGLDALFVDNVVLSGFAGWIAEEGLTPFTAPLYSGSDGDKNPSLLEYAVGLSPVEFELPYRPELTVTPTSVSLTAQTNPEATGVTLNYEYSTSLREDSWKDFLLDEDGAFEGASIPPEAFFRVTVTSP
ncbi:MAG: Calx-beta domain-containing protein [Verrucomicrobiota bacterium JB023]|nr:Calx-beta domain-containing protein [Verrucomicrobiota bacterium JB023]